LRRAGSENWAHGKPTARMHNALCSFCSDGKGIHPDASERNGE